MKVKILFWIAILNLIGIGLVYALSFVTRNNHYAVSIDTFFISASAVILILSLILKLKTAILASIIALVLGGCMNVFNISISYQKWIEREQPEIGHRYADFDSDNL